MTLQQSPYLREQRQFPNDDLKELANQSDHAYIDVASKVNARIIGTFATNFPIITGERWYTQGSNQKQQTLRQIYRFTGAGNVAHGINMNGVSTFTRCWGNYSDGTNFYGVIWATSTPVANQVSFYVTPMNIVISVNGTAPAVTAGYIILEWLSNV